MHDTLQHRLRSIWPPFFKSRKRGSVSLSRSYAPDVRAGKTEHVYSPVEAQLVLIKAAVPQKESTSPCMRLHV